MSDAGFRKIQDVWSQSISSLLQTRSLSFMDEIKSKYSLKRLTLKYNQESWSITQDLQDEECRELCLTNPNQQSARVVYNKVLCLVCFNGARVMKPEVDLLLVADPISVYVGLTKSVHTNTIENILEGLCHAKQMGVN
jgi:hypothetical protein